MVPAVGAAAGISARLSGDHEALIAVRLLRFDGDVVHVGAARTVVAPVDDRVDGVGVAFEGRFDPAIVQVPDEPGHVAPDGLLTAAPPEPDALDVAGDEDVHPLPFGHGGGLCQGVSAPTRAVFAQQASDMSDVSDTVHGITSRYCGRPSAPI